MSGPHSAGKGDRRRPAAISDAQLEDNWSAIKWQKREMRLIQCNRQWYVIPADEVSVFVHWCSAEKCQRHYPADHRPIRVDGPEGITFTEWKVVEKREGAR